MRMRFFLPVERQCITLAHFLSTCVRLEWVERVMATTREVCDFETAMARFDMDVFFNYPGGTRILNGRAGPGKRADKEGKVGKCDLSFQRHDTSGVLTEEIQSAAANELIDNFLSRDAGNKFMSQSEIGRAHV